MVRHPSSSGIMVSVIAIEGETVRLVAGIVRHRHRGDRRPASTQK